MLNVKLKWIEFENLRTGLKIERVVFNDDITLLVGLSGVGKTQILNAIEYSLKLAVNKNLRLEPYNTTLCFQIGEEVYGWHLVCWLELHFWSQPQSVFRCTEARHIIECFRMSLMLFFLKMGNGQEKIVW